MGDGGNPMTINAFYLQQAVMAALWLWAIWAAYTTVKELLNDDEKTA
jgi:hypothetical protein